MLIPQLIEIIVDSLRKDLFSNASFFAERLLCETDTEDVRYLLGKAYIGEGKYHKAFYILKDSKKDQNRYILAQVCLKLNRLVEGERALLTDKHFSKNILSKDLESVIPNGSAGYFLLGLITEKLGNRPIDTLNAYRKALEMDPFMWCAYEKICKLCPNKIDTSKIFGELNPKIISFKKNLPSNGLNSHNTHLNITPNNNLLSNQPKDFSLSPDNNMLSNKFNSVENKFNSVENKFQIHRQVNRFNLINTGNSEENEFNSNQTNNRFKTFQEIPQIQINGTNFTNSNGNNLNMNTSINPNMTPVVNKDKPEDYGNLNYNQPLIKNRDNLKPFTYSSSPNNMMLEFNKSSDVQSNLNSSMEMKQKYGDSVIKPFNISQSNLVFNEFTPHNIRNMIQGGSSRTNLTGSNLKDQEIQQNLQQNNIFNNINLNEGGAKGPNYTITNSNVSNSNYSTIKNIHNNTQNNIQNQNYANNVSTFNDISSLLKYFAEILKVFSLYNCEEAIKLIKNLPCTHQKSGWTYTILGRCYFEMSKYKDCDKVFKDCIKVDPSRLEGLEYYSSCLWQLKDQFQLVNLSNHVLEQSHFSPETWIVVGNCYSLQKEHEVAIKFFNRAIQINPSLAYAYTLCGHEYVEIESYGQARQYFSNAISCDDRQDLKFKN